MQKRGINTLNNKERKIQNNNKNSGEQLKSSKRKSANMQIMFWLQMINTVTNTVNNTIIKTA